MKGYLFLATSYFGLVVLANWLASRYVISVSFGEWRRRASSALAACWFSAIGCSSCAVKGAIIDVTAQAAAS